MIHFDFGAPRRTVLPVTRLTPSVLRDFFRGYQAAYDEYEFLHLDERDGKMSAYERLELEGSKAAFDEYLSAILSHRCAGGRPGDFFGGGFTTCILQAVDSDRTALLGLARSFEAVHNQIVGYLTGLSIHGDGQIYEAEVKQFQDIQSAVENALFKSEPWFRACEVRYGVGILFGLIITVDEDCSAAKNWRDRPIVNGFRPSEPPERLLINNGKLERRHRSRAT